MASTDSSSQPQFSTAEYHAPEGTDVCKFCHNPVNGTYYRLNGAMACTACTQQAQTSLPKDSHGAFTRGLMFGVGGAVLGLTLYSVIGIVTGLAIGYVSLAVGWIVGKSITKGSGGIGGRRYQVAALILTYAAVSMSAIPIGISSMIKNHKAAQTQKAETSAGVNNEQGPTQTQEDTPSEKRMGAGAAIALLALYGLASPFLELQSPLSGIIGIFILLIGIRIAWQMTAGPALKVEGPY